MKQEPSITINLRLDVDTFEWIKDQGVRVGLVPTTAARALFYAAKNQGITLAPDPVAGK